MKSKVGAPERSNGISVMRQRAIVNWNLARRALTGGAAGLALSVALTFSATDAQAECDTFYRVVPGDTLRGIAVQNIGNEDYQTIFRANDDILQTPALIEVGQLLYLPCADKFQDRRSALAAAGITATPRDNLGDRLAPVETADIPSETTEEPALVDGAPADDDAPAILRSAAGAVTVLTGTGLAPLVDRSLPAHGMVPLILGEALSAAEDPRKLELAFVDDWKAHLPVLMPTGAFPLGAPWPKPDCDAADLDRKAREFCQTYVFSEAFYEMPINVLVRPDSPLVSARADKSLGDQRICRPVGFPTFDLERMRVNLKVISAQTSTDCARMVLDGEADAISLPEPEADRLLSVETLSGKLVRARYLTRSVPIHAIALRGDQTGEQLIDLIDQGLTKMHESGRWVELITSYLRDIRRLPNN